MFDGISSLEPGHCLTIRGGEVVDRSQYWSIDFSVDTEQSEAYFVDHLLFLLQDSVRLRLRSDVPVASVPERWLRLDGRQLPRRGAARGPS